jgi:hypothetical protein
MPTIELCLHLAEVSFQYADVMAHIAEAVGKWIGKG